MRDVELDLEIESVREVEVEKELTYKNNKKLRVYNDLENGRKLIDMFAAVALNLVSYEEFVSNVEGYYVITENQLMQFINQGYEIEYIELQRKLELYYVSNDEKKVNDNYQKPDFKKSTNSKIVDLKELRDQIVNEEIYELKDSNSKKL